MDLRNFYITGVINNTKGIQQPDHHTDHHHNIQNLLNLAIHGYVGIDKPKQNADHDQSDDKRY